MFSFVAPLLIILSLAGIIIIILRRTPEARALRLPKFNQETFFSTLRKLGQGLRWSGRTFWHYVLEAKEISKASGSFLARQNFRDKFQRVGIHFPKPKLPFFGNSDSVEFFLHQAEASLSREDYLDAERQFIKVIEKDPKSEAAYAGLGKLYLAQRKFDEAAQTYNFLVKHHPTNDGYHSSLGQIYHGQKLYDKAAVAYERAIELAPANSKRYINLGLTLEAQKHLEEAILNYRKAVEMEKDNPQFLLVLSEALLKKGEKEQAEAVLEQILVLEPTNHHAREKLMQLKF